MLLLIWENIYLRQMKIKTAEPEAKIIQPSDATEAKLSWGKVTDKQGDYEAEIKCLVNNL